uniref:Reverse transcriptase Ty1/copia-type domain-containing protein n=1 Tax=Chromera velia CCMP2878 TaxID=1169474 RepID=A0A0G4IEL3_9ALVE|eukprot:Cvel_13732.t1-p1 / transcript=Cvel_13732.t1 / gene=Cvel_13732 / organism=Chromera_velia_CCMP2878 / gene_product=hypothetical protein / transcript_product=hypothetical protein / location=Cvel_scaffold950:6924-13910(-) / protein_length=647 / sequence_SO=supercontig / SO=protein_coding / is_pseudo=false
MQEAQDDKKVQGAQKGKRVQGAQDDSKEGERKKVRREENGFRKAPQRLVVDKKVVDQMMKHMNPRKGHIDAKEEEVEKGLFDEAMRGELKSFEENKVLKINELPGHVPTGSPEGFAPGVIAEEGWEEIVESIFVLKDKKKKVKAVMAVHVDDLLIFSANPAHDFEPLRQRLKMDEPEILSAGGEIGYTGLEVRKNESGFEISQEAYLKSIPVQTDDLPRKSLSPEMLNEEREEEKEEDLVAVMMKVMGVLGWVCRTSADLAFVFNLTIGSKLFQDIITLADFFDAKELVREIRSEVKRLLTLYSPLSRQRVLEVRKSAQAVLRTLTDCTLRHTDQDPPSPSLLHMMLQSEMVALFRFGGLLFVQSEDQNAPSQTDQKDEEPENLKEGETRKYTAGLFAKPQAELHSEELKAKDLVTFGGCPASGDPVFEHVKRAWTPTGWSVETKGKGQGVGKATVLRIPLFLANSGISLARKSAEGAGGPIRSRGGFVDSSSSESDEVTEKTSDKPSGISVSLMGARTFFSVHAKVPYDQSARYERTMNHPLLKQLQAAVDSRNLSASDILVEEVDDVAAAGTAGGAEDRVKVFSVKIRGDTQPKRKQREANNTKDEPQSRTDLAHVSENPGAHSTSFLAGTSDTTAEALQVSRVC